MSDQQSIPAYADPKHPFNDATHHSGKPCIVRGCDRPAGTGWSPFFCQPHNAERMDRIGRALEGELARRSVGDA